MDRKKEIRLSVVMLVLVVTGMGAVLAVNQEVTVTVLNGTDIGNESYGPLCVFEDSDVRLSADVNFMDCMGNVSLGVNISGTFYEFDVVNSLGLNYWYVLENGYLSRGDEVLWQYFAEDCYNFSYNGSVENFYVNPVTDLIIDPPVPDGDNGWYVTVPEFSLGNSDALNILYRWDSLDNLPYTAPFRLEDIPNPIPPESAGTLDLHYFANVSCGLEDEKSETFYVDLTDPLITDLVPAHNENVYNDLRPMISVYLDEVYQSNSGINPDSVVMRLDGIEVDSDVVDADSIDMTASYTPDYNLLEGFHNVSIYVEDNAGRISELTWVFEIVLTGIFDLNIHSPIDGVIYDSRRVLFNLTTSEDVVSIEYIDWDYRRPRWKKLCRNCDEYGFFRKRTKSFKDGENNISIRAIDEFGFSKKEDFSFFIDSKKPRISRTYPSRNKFANGSFEVQLKEENPVSLKLYYGDDEEELNLDEECEIVKKKYYCSKSVNLSDYDGQEIEYWFELKDIANNSDKSRATKIKVDTTLPVLENPDSFWVRGDGRSSRYIYFDISIDEDNFDKAVLTYEYRDKTRKKTLCSRLRDGRCKKRFTIREDYSDLKLTILDDAGNFILTELDEFKIGVL